MADDRPVLSPEEAIAALAKELEDLRTTMAARLLVRPTGDIEPTFRTTAKPGCLLLQGQTVDRLAFPQLWTWANEQGLVGTVFGVGNGSTTFTLPDMRGRVFVAAGTLSGNTYTIGAVGGSAQPVISINQMPNHTHNVSVNDHPSHGHSGSVDAHPGHGHFEDQAGNHGGHSSGVANVVPPGSGITLPSGYNAGGGQHGHNIQFSGTQSHNMNINGSGAMGHTVNQSGAGGGQGFDVRQPYLVGNWEIWT